MQTRFNHVKSNITTHFIIFFSHRILVGVQQVHSRHISAMAQQIDNLYFCVYLVEHKKNILIPRKWCTIDLAYSINSSLNRNANYVIFYAPNDEAEPNFNLPILNGKFNPRVAGCHVAKLTYCYCEYIFSINFKINYFGLNLLFFSKILASKAAGENGIESRRAVVPGVYNYELSGGRNVAETQLISSNELNVAVQSRQERFNVKIEKFADEISQVRKRNVNRPIQHGFEQLDDSDIEEIQDIINDGDSDAENELAVQVVNEQAPENSNDISQSINGQESQALSAGLSAEPINTGECQRNDISTTTSESENDSVVASSSKTQENGSSTGRDGDNAVGGLVLVCPTDDVLSGTIQFHQNVSN